MERDGLADFFIQESMLLTSFAHISPYMERLGG